MKMDEKPINTKDLVQLAKLALAGKPKETTMFIRRLINTYRLEIPELSEQLGQLLRKQHSESTTPLRGAIVDEIPVDLDSRLQLARPEYDVRVEVEPIWSQEVHGKLEQIVKERRRVSDLEAAGLTPTKSALFVGAPGVGKTLAAKWIAEALDLPLITLDLAAVMSSFLGRTGNNVRNVLDYARGVSCVLLLDEFDAIAKRRDDVVELGELKRLVTVLLQEIDAWPPSGLLIAATNHPELLDPAVWRRFDVIIKFPMPSESQIASLIRRHLAPDGVAEWADVVAAALSGESFAEVQRDLFKAMRSAILEDVPLVSVLQNIVKERARSLKRDRRFRLAADLVARGLSRRAAHEWTGVSRDTIRKAISNGNRSD